MAIKIIERCILFCNALYFEAEVMVVYFRTNLEIVSWRACPGPLIVRACASTPGSRRCKFSDLVPSKILQNLYFDRKYL